MTKSPYPDAAADIRRRIAQIREAIEEEADRAGRDPKGIALMAVTKTVPPERVNAALEAGVDLLGENRAQELREKFQFYHCKWKKIHFIGHLQTNKIRDIISRVSCVQSVDSIHLAEALGKACQEADRQLPVLMQINIGHEETKSGFLPEMAAGAARQIAGIPNLKLQGLMTIPPRSSDDRYLLAMEELRQRLEALGIPGASFAELSMGMSEDYRLAVRCGATILRIGRGIFGQRGQ